MRDHVRLASCVFAVALIVAPALAAADVVTQWNSAALDAIRSNRTAPPVASRALAILHVSIFDAVNGIDRSYKPFFVQGRPRDGASKEAAASAAAHRVLVELFPNHATTFDELHRATLEGIRSDVRRSRGTAWGDAVASQILAWRANDNSDAVVPAPSGEGVGVWVPTPTAFAPYLLPHWGFVEPFAMPTGPHFRPTGPPSVESGEYAKDYAEVKAFGARVGSARTPDQDQIALFWADGAGTETPPGHWNSIARGVAEDRRNNLIENARLFALLNVAMADAAICSWDAKYAFNSWRPVTAIVNGDADGNPATVGDPTWSSVHRHTALPRLRVRSQHVQRRRSTSPRTLLSNKSDFVHDWLRFPAWRDAAFQKLLGCGRRSGNQPAVWRHSFQIRQP